MELSIDNYEGVFDSRVGWGKSPAVLVIDFVQAYTNPDSPLYAPEVPKSILRTNDLIREARRFELPIVFTQVLYQPNLSDGGLFVKKVPVLKNFTRDHPWASFPPELDKCDQDTIITKQYASCFFGTSLASMLNAMKIDTLVVAGCSTSGCVRATVVDGMQLGFHMIVAEECVADRDPRPHESALFDMNAKYGDVVSLSEAIEQIGIAGVALGGIT